MKRFTDLLNENIQQAKAYLRTKNIVPEDDYLFQVIKDRLQGKEGYVGWFTKIAHENIKPNSQTNGDVINEVEKIFKKIEENPQIIELLETPVTQQKTLEDFQDDYEKATLKYKTKNVYNQFPRTQKDLININDKDIISSLSKLYDIDYKAFIRKISSYHTKEELLKGIDRFLSGDSNTEFDDILDNLEKIGSPIVYADENRDLIIANILNFKQCDIIGSRTSWCIVGSSSTFNSYVNPDNGGVQYAIYLTDKSYSNNNRLIGATFNVNGFNTAHNVTDDYVSQSELKKILKDKGYDIKKLMVTKEAIKNKNIDNFNIKSLIKLGFTFDEVMKKKNKFSYNDILYLKEKGYDITKYYDKIDYNTLIVKYLKELFSLEEILKRKTEYVRTDLEYFTKDEIIDNDLINKLTEKYYVEDLKKWGFTTEEILDKKKVIDHFEIKNFTEEEIEKYNIGDRLRIAGNDINKHVNNYGLTKEKFLSQLYRVEPNSIEFWHMANVLKMDAKDIKDHIEELKPLFSDISKEIYEKYLSKNKIENVYDLKYGSSFKDHNDPDKYSLDKTIFLLDWYDITPDNYKLNELTEILDDLSSYSIDTTYNKLKKLGYFKNDTVDTVFKFFKNLNRGHYTSDDITLLNSIFNLGYDVSDLVINHFLKKDEDGNYGRAVGGYGGKNELMDKVFGYTDERKNRNKVEKMLKDHPKELEKIIYYDDINEFYKYTLNVAEHTWSNDRDKPSPEKWLEKYGLPNVDMDWSDLSGRYKYECLMSYIILMAYNNKIEELYKLKGINWEAGKGNRGAFGTSVFGNLSEIIIDTDITNGSPTYKLEAKLDNDQRYKLYNWQIEYVYPSIIDKDDFEQDLQLVYFIYDRIALNQLIEKVKKYNLLPKVIEIFTPLFNYLIDTQSKNTFFYKEQRFDRILDIKYYLNQVFGNYDGFTNKEIEKLEYVLIKKAHYTADVESFNKSNEIVKNFIDKKRKTPKGTIGTIMGQRKVTAESKVMNFYNYIKEKVQPDFFEKNPDFYLSKNKKEIDEIKSKPKEKNKYEEEYKKEIKRVNYNDIKFVWNNENSAWQVTEPSYFRNNLYIKKYRSGDDVRYYLDLDYYSEYNYKILLAAIKSINEPSMLFDKIEKEMINPTFKEIDEFYAICFTDHYYKLFLTKNVKEFKQKLHEIKESNDKIIYTNYKTKGKELLDYDGISRTKLKNELKNISYEDIKFKSTDDGRNFDAILPNGTVLPSFFTKEGSSMGSNKVYFGHLKNRFHVQGGLDKDLRGIGLGYKLYKAFLKYNGYFVSDEQTSTGARKMYYHLLKDDNVLHVIDQNPGDIKFDAEDEEYFSELDNLDKSKYSEYKWKLLMIMKKEREEEKKEKINRMSNSPYKPDSQKVLLVWKDHPKIEKLLKLVRKHELRNNRKYKYDKDLLKYIENVKED